ncbi:MAG: PqqD family protein [Mobilitalea sp.]
MKYKLNENVYLYDSYDGLKYLVDLDTNDSYQLNQTSYYICSLIEKEGMDLDSITNNLLLKLMHPVEKKMLKCDLEFFVNEMKEKKYFIVEYQHE